ncbi:MAG TPA: glycerate kinase [Ilumatobacteraceae bacterium]|nr:glycerate kinase [Ilumatobacteraceae bacterium]
MRVAAAVDKFKGTASGKQVAAAVGSACWELGHDCTELPMADGGEGTLEALGGANRTSVVTGPLGDPVNAEWRMYRGTAVIEMARASGLTLIGGAVNNDAMAASTIGTGELIDMALDAGAKKIIVCLGGSATTDGGYGALRAITSPHRLRGVKLLVACDVRTRFLEAAEVFGPQKGASPAQVKLLTGRLQRLAQIYQHDYGIDVREIEGTGAAGGIAGALVALGGRLVPGFDLVADELDLHDVIAAADIVITGEGYLDEQSFEGKVVGGVQEMAAEAGKPVGAIVGDAAPEVASRIEHISLVDDYGNDKAMNEPLWCIERAAAAMLQRLTERRS